MKLIFTLANKTKETKRLLLKLGVSPALVENASRVGIELTEDDFDKATLLEEITSDKKSWSESVNQIAHDVHSAGGTAFIDLSPKSITGNG